MDICKPKPLADEYEQVPSCWNQNKAKNPLCFVFADRRKKKMVFEGRFTQSFEWDHLIWHISTINYKVNHYYQVGSIENPLRY